MATDYEFKIAGYTEAKLKVGVGVWQCEAVKDGVTFEVGKEGVWVLSYQDLLEIVRLATEERAQKEASATA